MIEIKVIAKLNGGNRVLTAKDKVNTQQEAYFSAIGFANWFVSVYAKSDMIPVHQGLKGISIKTEPQASTIFKYSSENVNLQVTSKRI